MLSLLILFVAIPAKAFLYEVEVLSQEEVIKLSNAELLDLYTQASIERRASEAFHHGAGFQPRDYRQYRELLGFIVRLRQEIDYRHLETTAVDVELGMSARAADYLIK